MYRAIIFDFFGTLVSSFSSTRYRRVIEKMASLVHAPVRAFTERWLETFQERVTGVFPDVESNIRSICGELGVSPSSEECARAVRVRFEFAREHLIPREGAIDVLRTLKKRGYLLGLLTDCSSELPSLWDETAFQPLFDATVFSCKVGIRKPAPEIYEELCRRLGVSPGECLYVGDGGSNELSGAERAGMTAILLFDEAEQGATDIIRIDGEDWQGPQILGLEEILYVCATNRRR